MPSHRAAERPGPPEQPPIGLLLNRVARQVSREFDETLAAAGGSRSIWLVLLALTINAEANQTELADSVGIRGATLTHHLNAMEKAGLVVRARDPQSRRSHVIRRTPTGDELFLRLREAAAGFDNRLRSGLSAREVQALAELLGKLSASVGQG
jgi:MarR family transcriptional regulator, transcriptional regulator for hemolysin